MPTSDALSGIKQPANLKIDLHKSTFQLQTEPAEV